MDAAAEIVSLRAQLAERAAKLATAHLLIEQYKAQLHKLRRMQFGQSSEALDTQIEQLELQLEDLEGTEAARVAATPQPRPARSPRCANLCRCICRVRMWCTQLPRSAPIVAARIWSNSARTSPRCWRKSRPG